MISKVVFAALSVCFSYTQGYQYEDVLSVAPSNRTVSTRTGTFIGDFNDTYPAVRQFKYVPYAKVSSLDQPSEYLKLTIHSHLPVAADGHRLHPWTRHLS